MLPQSGVVTGLDVLAPEHFESLMLLTLPSVSIMTATSPGAENPQNFCLSIIHILCAPGRIHNSILTILESRPCTSVLTISNDDQSLSSIELKSLRRGSAIESGRQLEASSDQPRRCDVLRRLELRYTRMRFRNPLQLQFPRSRMPSQLIKRPTCNTCSV